MRILLFQETNWINRNVIHQHHLAERLAQRGHAVQVVDYDILWSERKQRRWWQPREVFPAVSRAVPGVALPVIRPATLQLPLACHLSWAASSLAEVRRLLRTWQPDIVVGLTLTNSYPLACMLMRACVPFVDVVLEPYHTMMPERWVRPMARAMERLALKAAQRVVVFTPQMRSYVRQMGAPEERITVLKTGVNLDQFHPGVNGARQRASLGINGDGWLIFFMGWLYDFSGLRQIAASLAQDPGLLDGARLMIVGDGDLYPELKELVEQNNLAPRVILAGHRPYAEIPGLLAAADVCLLPSLENDTTRDIVPMKVYEYLAAGKPVVASRLPGLLAEFGHEGGIAYGENPVDVLTRAVELRSRPAEARQLGMAGRRMAEQNADWERTTDCFEGLLRRAAEEMAEGGG